MSLYSALPTGSLGLTTFPSPAVLSPKLFLAPHTHSLFLFVNSLDTCLFQEFFQDWEGHWAYGGKSMSSGVKHTWAVFSALPLTG